MHRERFILWSVIIILLAILCYIWMHSQSFRSLDSTSKMDSILTVPVSRIQATDVHIQQKYLGKVQAIQSVLIHPYLSGFIDKINVKGGQTIQTGDLMFVLQQSEYQAKQDQALAQIARAEATLANASAYLKRVKRTVSKAVSQTEVDNAKAAFLSAQAEVKVAQSMLKNANVLYNYTEIKAPIDGIVGDVNVTLGDYVSPESAPLVNLVQYNPIKIVFSIPYKEYISLNQSLFQGWQMNLILGNGQVYSEQGRLMFADNQVNPNTASVRLYAHIQNPYKILLPDAYVTILLDKKIKGMYLKKNWVHFSPEGQFVYLLKDGTIMRQPVIIMGSLNDSFIISHPVSEQYLVITSTLKSDWIGQKAIPIESNEIDSLSDEKKEIHEEGKDAVLKTSDNKGSVTATEKEK